MYNRSMEDMEFLISRIKDLDRVSYERGIEKHTGFMTLKEQSVYYSLIPGLLGKCSRLEGGHSDAERRLIIWPSEYEETAPENIISCVLAKPVNERFTDKLSHRDYLGALMNLGIERSTLGDILIDSKTNFAYIYCLSDMADYIAENLSKVKHTGIICKVISLSECSIKPELKELKVNVASERIDAIIAAVFKLSRSTASNLITSEEVYVDGRAVKSATVKLYDGARISVRGYGKFIYSGLSGESRKGRLYITILLYI